MSNDLSSLEDVLAVVEPGETVAYSELLERMKADGRIPRGMMLVLGDGTTQVFHHGREITAWREPYWDTEVEGGWAPGTLYIARRPE